MKNIFLFLFLSIALVIPGFLQAQVPTATLNGSVSVLSEPLQGAFVRVASISRGTQSDASGKFTLKLPAETDLLVEVTYLGMKTRKYRIRLKVNEVRQLNAELEEEIKEVTEHVVTGKREFRDQVSITTIDPKVAKLMPSPFGDFNKVLATLPGVVSNSELSSS